MIYVMSDLHGCYDKYKQMLEKIKFNSDDMLYVLGDVIDRGTDGIEILLDMMKFTNIVPMLGNHEYMAYRALKKLNVEITEYNYDSHLNSEIMEIYEDWMYNGGMATYSAFSKLDKETRSDVIDYIGEFDLYEEIDINENKFVLVHGGLDEFKEDKPLYEYNIYDIICSRCDYTKQYYSDKYLVTGHTPTFSIDEKYRDRIYKEKNHIAIDCGVVYGSTLGCICLNTLEEFYV